MAKPEILKAIHELDEQGFYNNTEYLGDLTTDTTCLDNVKKNGIYSFTAYKDFTGSASSDTCRWILRVYACEDCSQAEQIIEPLALEGRVEQRRRYFIDGAWTDFRYATVAASYSAADSDKLGGHTPDYYATQSDLENVQGNLTDISADKVMMISGLSLQETIGAINRIDFTDEEGNPTDEPYIHYYVDSTTGQAVTYGIPNAEDGEF